MSDPYNKISESLNLLAELTGRVDERLKLLVAQHDTLSERLERQGDRQDDILARLAVLESKHDEASLRHIQEDLQSIRLKLSELEYRGAGQENKWRMAGDFFFKMLLTAVGAVIAWKLSKP